MKTLCVRLSSAIENARPIRARGGEGVKTARKGRFYSFQTACGGAVCLKRKESSALCGVRQGLRALDCATF